MNELNILFATNFSDSCFRAIRAVAQLADTFKLQLTVAHADQSDTPRRQDLHSFFAEADHFGHCRRVTLSGPPAAAIAAYTKQHHFDLVLSPGSDRLGLPRPFHRSIRAGLLRDGASPVWTTSRGLEAADFRRPIRNIAVAIDGVEDGLQHLNLAAAFADRTGANLRLLTVVPDVSEGTLASNAVRPQPLHPEAAIERINAMLNGWHRTPIVDVAVGTASQEIPRMAARFDTDLLFLSEAQSVSGFFSDRISRTVSRSPSPVICVPAALAPRFQWSFQKQVRLVTIPERETVSV